MKTKTRRRIEAEQLTERVARRVAAYVAHAKKNSRRDGIDRIVYRTADGWYGVIKPAHAHDPTWKVDTETLTSMPGYFRCTVVAYVPAKGRVQWKQEG